MRNPLKFHKNRTGIATLKNEENGKRFGWILLSIVVSCHNPPHAESDAICKPFCTFAPVLFQQLIQKGGGTVPDDALATLIQ
jgi:hypothetical protein